MSPGLRRYFEADIVINEDGIVIKSRFGVPPYKFHQAEVIPGTLVYFAKQEDLR